MLIPVCTACRVAYYMLSLLLQAFHVLSSSPSFLLAYLALASGMLVSGRVQVLAYVLVRCFACLHVYSIICLCMVPILAQGPLWDKIVFPPSPPSYWIYPGRDRCPRPSGAAEATAHRAAVVSFLGLSLTPPSPNIHLIRPLRCIC